MDRLNIPEQLISVIMPMYNCEKYIEEAINSVLAQTYDAWELIVIDDGSMDSTASIVEELSKDDIRIRFYRNEKNEGVSATRNAGVLLARGDWIAFLDSDDMWEKSKLEKQMFFARDLNANFVFTGASFINENSEPYNGIFNVPLKVVYKELLKQNVISCSSVMIKKDYIIKYKMENDNTHEDFGSWLRILKKEQYAYAINEPLLIYRISSKSKSSNKVKSLKMAYKTYRFVGINPVTAIYYMGWYVVRGLRKYRYIKK